VSLGRLGDRERRILPKKRGGAEWRIHAGDAEALEKKIPLAEVVEDHKPTSGMHELREIVGVKRAFRMDYDDGIRRL
jgi:hypothetical protein